ncbi:Abortive infection protein [Xylanimonas cellulosilytica DSM 15894]|uniref:Abortive infection protein n=1 Tax=Xylanimonas cellulosilytica (strain DSM 15894 / JCM 12276 / CECT 5975 / KCTC 9989 / LMG 20990 / NBRC 107835 / XIL07) TaxID=446471 RepID=D1C0Q7_XYLCX|nr:CPBP family intramembrane glutamic endopeptidase [Xylanimonas cellulosilytica]ACZ32260.1 Abortive infection protein [Xylanimonas cellulosilytica DSM 15894]
MTAAAVPAPTDVARRRILWEIWILLGLSLGRSAVYAVVDIGARLTAGVPLAEQTATLNPSRSPRPYLDLTYQVLQVGFAVVPVLLAVYLLAIRRGAPPVSRAIGFDWHLRRRAVFDPDVAGASHPPAAGRRRRDVAWGFALAAAIGLPGLAFYAVGRLLGITVSIEASALADHWWTVPVLILAALQNGALEEVIVVAYLFERTRDLGWSPTDRLDWRFLVTSALLRGSYHLYQGFGPFLGNVVMGVVFAWWYRSRWGRRRVIPLVVAHTVLDVVAFVGYALIPAGWREALGIT